jgi:hypothetical protein
MFSSTGHFVANIYMNNILPDLIDSSLLESLSDEGTFGRDRRSGCPVVLERDKCRL